MKYPDNIVAVSALHVDFMGFIFYPRSPRFIPGEEAETAVSAVANGVRKVGVFVNESIDTVKDTCARLNLDFAQLHGGETVEYVKEIHGIGISLIKVFSIDKAFNWKSTTAFEDYSTYFLFDTAAAGYGGSGSKFDWNTLGGYQGDTPFFLSGGIGPKDISTIKTLSHPQLLGIDVNSGMETEPGLKDINLINQTINQINR